MLIQLNLFLSLALSFTIVYFVIPKIVKVSKIKNLFDIPNHRSAAKRATPRLGGVAILAGFVISLIISADNLNINSMKYLFVGVMTMFMIGIKDDFIGLDAKKKFLIQILMAVYLVTLGHFNITNLHGILGIYEINYISGALISILIIVGIINSLNLIDGVDGLASGISLLISVVYGIYFLLAGDLLYALTCFSLTGGLIAFFLYNVFGKTNKIFMGDSGSLVLGTIIALATIHFNEMTPLNTNIPEGLPAISFAIVMVPVIDTLRVFAIRIRQKKSPFSPDMNHIHHNLLALTKSHLSTTLIILAVNGFMILLAISLIDVIGNGYLFLLLVLTGFAFANIPALLLKIQKQNTVEVPEGKSAFALFIFLKKLRA